MSYQEHFEQIVKDQLERVERMKNAPAAPDFASKDKVVIGALVSVSEVVNVFYLSMQFTIEQINWEDFVDDQNS